MPRRNFNFHPYSAEEEVFLLTCPARIWSTGGYTMDPRQAPDPVQANDRGKTFNQAGEIGFGVAVYSCDVLPNLVTKRKY